MKRKIWLWLLVVAGVWLVNRQGWLSGWRKPMVAFKFFLRSQQLPKIDSSQRERLTWECRLKLASLSNRLKAYEKLLGTPIKPQTQFIEARLIAVGSKKLQIVFPQKASWQNLLHHWVVFGQTVLGQITRVQGEIGLVNLIGDPPLSAQVWINNREPVWGKLQREGENLLLTSVPVQAKVSKGDLVSVTLPSGDIFLVGEVKSASLTADKLFWEAVIQPALDPHWLLTVFVIR